MESMFLASVIFISASLTIPKIASLIGEIAGNALSELNSYSALDISKGDKRLIKQHTQSTKISVFKAIAAPAVTVLLNIVSAWIAATIGTF